MPNTYNPNYPIRASVMLAETTVSEREESMPLRADKAIPRIQKTMQADSAMEE